MSHFLVLLAPRGVSRSEALKGDVMADVLDVWAATREQVETLFPDALRIVKL